MIKHLALLLAFASPAGAASWTMESYLKEVYSVSHDLKQAEEAVQLARSSYISSLASFYLPSVLLSAAYFSCGAAPRIFFIKSLPRKIRMAS